MAVFLDGGPSELGQASTIIDCTGEELVVLREGGISEQKLREVAFGAQASAGATAAAASSAEVGNSADEEVSNVAESETAKADEQPSSARSRTVSARDDASVTDKLDDDGDEGVSSVSFGPPSGSAG